MGISVTVTFFYFKMDTILLSFLKTNAEVGIYNAAYKIIENLAFFPGMVAGLMLPIFSRTIINDRQKFEEFSNKVYKIFVILVVPLVVGTLYLADEVIFIIGGAGYEGAGLILKILIFSLIFIFFGNLNNNILLAGNLQKKLIITLAFCAIFNISANLIFIPIYSYLGAAGVSVATESLVVIITFFLMTKYLLYFPRFESIFKIITSGLLMAITLYFLQETNFLVQFFSASIIYFLAVWVLEVVTPQEIRGIIQRA